MRTKLFLILFLFISFQGKLYAEPEIPLTKESQHLLSFASYLNKVATNSQMAAEADFSIPHFDKFVVLFPNTATGYLVDFLSGRLLPESFPADSFAVKAAKDWVIATTQQPPWQDENLEYQTLIGLKSLSVLFMMHTSDPETYTRAHIEKAKENLGQLVGSPEKIFAQMLAPPSLEASLPCPVLSIRQHLMIYALLGYISIEELGNYLLSLNKSVSTIFADIVPNRRDRLSGYGEAALRDNPARARQKRFIENLKEKDYLNLNESETSFLSALPLDAQLGAYLAAKGQPTQSSPQEASSASQKKEDSSTEQMRFSYRGINLLLKSLKENPDRFFEEEIALEKLIHTIEQLVQDQNGPSEKYAFELVQAAMEAAKSRFDPSAAFHPRETSGFYTLRQGSYHYEEHPFVMSVSWTRLFSAMLNLSVKRMEAGEKQFLEVLEYFSNQKVSPGWPLVFSPFEEIKALGAILKHANKKTIQFQYALDTLLDFSKLEKSASMRHNLARGQGFSGAADIARGYLADFLVSEILGQDSSTQLILVARAAAGAGVFRDILLSENQFDYQSHNFMELNSQPHFFPLARMMIARKFLNHPELFFSNRKSKSLDWKILVVSWLFALVEFDHDGHENFHRLLPLASSQIAKINEVSEMALSDAYAAKCQHELAQAMLKGKLEL